MIYKEAIAEYRNYTFRLNSDRRINKLSQVVEFVDERGFVLFWPIKGMVMPSLWQAVAGDRPVPNNHDDPAHITWRWKDQSLGLRKWYYAKILRKKATFVSLATIPYFYALSENYGTPDEDYLLDFQDGKLSLDEKLIYDAILSNGPLHTIELRNYLKRYGRSNEAEFKHAMESLQADLKILPVGIAEAGSWKYAYIYDLTSHHFPTLVDQARTISQSEAHSRIMGLYFLSVGYANQHDLQHIFGWSIGEIGKTLDELLHQNMIVLLKNDSKQSNQGYLFTKLKN